MKLNYSNCVLFLLLTLACILPACEELGPAIDFTETNAALIDTSYTTDSVFTPQSRVVLIEDFTGQECPNCPAAHEVIADIIADHGDAVAATTLYNYFLDVDEELPYVTPEAQEIGDYYGGISFWPQGTVNRKNYGSGVLIPKEQYAANTEAELAIAPQCNIGLATIYDETTRDLTVTVIIKYTADVSTANHLSVAICENNIIDFQINESGEIPDYVHNHVLRKMLTLATGTALSESNLAGRVYIKQFAITLPEDWVKENLDVIAYVHNFETDNKEVLQAAIEHLD